MAEPLYGEGVICLNMDTKQRLLKTFTFFHTVGHKKLDTELGTCMPQVVIFDPLYKILSGNINEGIAVEQLQNNLDSLKEKYKFTPILFAHPRQSLLTPSGDVIDTGADELMGSSYWPDWFDTMMKIIPEGEHSPVVNLRFDKTRHATNILPPFQAMFNRDTLHWDRVM